MPLFKRTIRQDTRPGGSEQRAPTGSSPPGFSFLVAAPRSGTTWMSRALNAHPEVFCTENRLFGMFSDVVRDRGATEPRTRMCLDKYVSGFVPHFDGGNLGGDAAALGARVLDGFVGSLASIAHELTGKRILVDKVTPFRGTAEVVADATRRHFPDAKVVQLVRDGRDVATSGVFHWLTKSVEGEPLEAEQIARRAYFLDGARDVPLTRFFSDRELDDWCGYWLTALDTVSRLNSELDVLTVRYEEMVDDLGVVLRRVFAHLGADDSEAVVQRCVEASSMAKMSGGRQRGQEDPVAHVRKGVVGDWKSYFTKRDGIAFRRRAGEALVRLGYEPDDSWVERLSERLDLPTTTSVPHA